MHEGVTSQNVHWMPKKKKKKIGKNVMMSLQIQEQEERERYTIRAKLKGMQKKMNRIMEWEGK